MVASDAPLATRVGVEILRSGGNAIDAAVATAFALAVVFPAAGNVGGGGFMVVHAADGTDAALDFRESAPRSATRDMFLDANGAPTERSLVGHLAAGVPGTVAGLWEAHHRFGSRPWRDLIAPAIELAAHGFVVDREFANSVRGDSARLSRFPATAALFLARGSPVGVGVTWSNPDLAATLRRVAERGPTGFYDGETADLIVAEMARGGGIISRRDLKHYQAKWRTPIALDYRGFRVVSMPPPSSGGVTLAVAANILRQYDLGPLGWHSADALQAQVEAMRRAFAVRNHYLGDPDFVEMPLEHLLSSGFADSLASSISLTRATPSAAVAFATGASAEGRHTTHFSVADAQGNAVALTTTINLAYGSAVTVAGAGFLLNNEMDDFATKPGTANVFGLVQGEANAVAPGKRMLSSMTPTIVLDSAGYPLLITGASGGPTIISTGWQIVSNVIDYGMGIAAAVSAPRIHHQHLPDRLFVEAGGLPASTLGALEARGNRVQVVPPGAIGIGASILRERGMWHGMADPRVEGLAAGY